MARAVPGTDWGEVMRKILVTLAAALLAVSIHAPSVQADDPDFLVIGGG